MDHPPVDRESGKYLEMVRSLADEYGVPVERALMLYELELKALEVNARVKIFLPLLATKRLRAALRVRRHYFSAQSHHTTA
jgi:hypothetical protein